MNIIIEDDVILLKNNTPQGTEMFSMPIDTTIDTNVSETTDDDDGTTTTVLSNDRWTFVLRSHGLIEIVYDMAHTIAYKRIPSAVANDIRTQLLEKFSPPSLENPPYAPSAGGAKRKTKRTRKNKKNKKTKTKY